MADAHDEQPYTLKWGKITLQVSSQEPFTFYATLLAGEYDKLVIRPGDYVIDAGANIGDFAIRAAVRVGPTGRVVAIEPGRVALKYLWRNAELNRVANLTIVESFLADRPGRVSLSDVGTYATVNPPGGSSFGETASEAFDGQMETLDEIVRRTCDGRLDVLKMDIEGREAEVLVSSKSLPKAREVLVETHGDAAERTTLEVLYGHGFSVRRIGQLDIVSSVLRNALLHIPSLAAAEIATKGFATRQALRGLGRSSAIPSLRTGSPIAMYHGTRSFPRSGRV